MTLVLYMQAHEPSNHRYYYDQTNVASNQMLLMVRVLGLSLKGIIASEMMCIKHHSYGNQTSSFISTCKDPTSPCFCATL